MKKSRYSNQYYLFSSKIKKGAAWIGTSDRYPGYDIVDCSVCGTQGIRPFPIRAYRPVELSVNKPGLCDDIQSAIGVLVVSKKFKDAVRKAKLRGIVFRKPKNVVLKRSGTKWSRTREDVIHKTEHWIGHIVGDGGSIAKQCGLKKKMDCPACGWEDWTVPRRKITVDLKQWDGSDFFRVHEYQPIMFSPRARDVLGKAGLSNFESMPISRPYWRR